MGGGIRIYSEEEFSGPTTGSEFNSNFIQFTDGDTGPNSLLAGTDSGGNGSITAEGVTAELNLIGTAGVKLAKLNRRCGHYSVWWRRYNFIFNRRR